MSEIEVQNHKPPIIRTRKSVADVFDDGLSITDSFALYLYRSIVFWLINTLLVISEPVVISLYPTSRFGRTLQLSVLVISTVSFGIQSYGESIDTRSESMRNKLVHIALNTKPFRSRVLHYISEFVGKGEYVLEALSFLIGWLFLVILNRPGIAALRCFRVFRILWYYEVKVVKEWIKRSRKTSWAKTVELIVKINKFAVRSLTALAAEMCMLTNATRGGMLLMIIFFYTAFVVGMLLWIETGQELHQCYSLGSCTFTMIRLSLYDGEGFDYAHDLYQNHPGLFYLVMAYLCITGFGILNGLIGIFGTAFTMQSEQTFAEDDDDDIDDHPGGGSINNNNKSNDSHRMDIDGKGNLSINSNQSAGGPGEDNHPFSSGYGLDLARESGRHSMATPRSMYTHRTMFNMGRTLDRASDKNMKHLQALLENQEMIMEQLVYLHKRIDELSYGGEIDRSSRSTGSRSSIKTKRLSSNKAKINFPYFSKFTRNSYHFNSEGRKRESMDSSNDHGSSKVSLDNNVSTKEVYSKNKKSASFELEVKNQLESSSQSKKANKFNSVSPSQSNEARINVTYNPITENPLDLQISREYRIARSMSQPQSLPLPPPPPITKPLQPRATLEEEGLGESAVRLASQPQQSKVVTRFF